MFFVIAIIFIIGDIKAIRDIEKLKIEIKKIDIELKKIEIENEKNV